MAYVDARGEQNDYDVSASVGIYRTYTAYDEDGAIYDLTNGTISAVVKDDKSQARDYGGVDGTETTYSQTITNAAAGQWTLSIPASEFTNKEGGRLSYEVKLTVNSVVIGILFGFINVLERG